MYHYNIGINNPMFGKENKWGYHTKNSKEKISKSVKGNKNSNYIDGRSIIQHYCIDCNKPITRQAIRCLNCSNSFKNSGKNHPLFGKKHKIKSKKLMSLSAGGTGVPYENNEYGSEFDNALKEQVRQRDKYKCRICGCSQLENGRQLDCHHIDYNKKNNNINNFISLCRRCHLLTKYNRKYWINHFQKGIYAKRTFL